MDCNGPTILSSGFHETIRPLLDSATPAVYVLRAGSAALEPLTTAGPFVSPQGLDLSADGRALLVHCLDTGDPEGEVATIKRRYETRLKEIFE